MTPTLRSDERAWLGSISRHGCATGPLAQVTSATSHIFAELHSAGMSS